MWRDNAFPETWLEGCQRPSKIMQDNAFSLDCPPKLDDKTLFLKTPHMLVTGHEEVKLALGSFLPNI